MNFMIYLSVGVFVGGIIFYANKLVERLQEQSHQNVKDAQKAHQDLMVRIEALYQEKLHLEEEAREIFTLYEMTKDITKSLSESEAFEIFKETLNTHVKFEECLFLDPESPSVKEWKERGEHFLFMLQGKDRLIGYLAVKGVREEDKEKLAILGHQFALALRRVKLYEEIERIAITDSLTDVHTRRYLLERFAEELARSAARGNHFSLLMIDVDHFKSFNDQYGHLTGDQILREIGRIIKENIREMDIAGRYGGEEFCIVLPDTDSAGAQYAAERIRKAADQSIIKAYDHEVKVTVSIGIATFPQNGQKVEELIDKADWALYRAKKSGRNCICLFGSYQEPAT